MIKKILLIACSIILISVNTPAFAKGAHKDFIAAFKKVEKYLRKGEMDKADKKIGEMSHYRKNNGFAEYEEAHYQLLIYWQAQKKGQKDLEEKHLNTLVEKGAGILDDEIYIPAAMDLMKQQVQNKEYGEVLQTVEWMKKEEKSAGQLKSVEGLLGKINAFVAGDQPLVQPVSVGGLTVASRILIRPSFYLDKVNGVVVKYYLNCENKQKEFPYTEGGSLTIPASWGKCRVDIHADDGTSFELVQLKG